MHSGLEPSGWGNCRACWSKRFQAGCFATWCMRTQGISLSGNPFFATQRECSSLVGTNVQKKRQNWERRAPSGWRTFSAKRAGKSGKSKEDSRSAGGDRTERGGKGGKSGGKGKDAAPDGKWLSTIFMEGKKHTLCMRYQNGTCKDPTTCRFLHRCAVPKPDGTACGGNHPAFQHVATPH